MAYSKLQSIESLLLESDKINNDNTEQNYLKVTVNTDQKQYSIYTKAPNSWNNFKKDMALMFPEEDTDNLHVYWSDFEKDKIDVDGEISYQTFLNANKFTYRHIYLEKPITANPGEIHENIFCNECKMKTIIGFRYKCIQCPEYNLCENCERRKIHNNHVMFRFPIPLKHLPISNKNCNRNNFSKISDNIDTDNNNCKEEINGNRHRSCNVKETDQNDVILSSLKDVAQSLLLTNLPSHNTNVNNSTVVNKEKDNGEILNKLNEMFLKLPKSSSITLTIHVSNNDNGENENSSKIKIDLKENVNNTEAKNVNEKIKIEKKGNVKENSSENNISTSVPIDVWKVNGEIKEIDENVSNSICQDDSLRSKGAYSKNNKNFHEFKENVKRPSNNKTENQNGLESWQEQKKSTPEQTNNDNNKKLRERKTLCKVVYHKDPRINEALHQLGNLGHTDDKGRLCEILESFMRSK